MPSSSLLPDSPNLLFTNAGMNQFVPLFLGQQRCPYRPPRAADTQKCIRAGGKHNDLEDVGLDTYHHTFFEMLGNWSFGDYFKPEAIQWAWELITEVWGFPKPRLYATVYCPDRAQGDPSEFDQEAYACWAEQFAKAGLDPRVHILNGNKQDNFWMMGETGPCGPCSEIHIDLTPAGDTQGALVNQGDARCIEIWNLVFIQFNADPDGSFSPLPARHVDTGMGFERVTSIIQGTRNFTDFAGARISNYETDIFRPLFDALEKLSGKKYTSTLPGGPALPRLPALAAAGGAAAPAPAGAPRPHSDQEQVDIAFRVIADHIRTLSFAVADGIMPGNTDRHYVLRRILRRAVRYGRTLGFHEPFFYKLAEVLAATMGDVFPEVRARQATVQAAIKAEEESFNKTLDRGVELFQEEVAGLAAGGQLSGEFAFQLYDTYGFPLDLTQLMAREGGWTVDTVGFERLMEAQRQQARAGQKKEIIRVTRLDTSAATQFVGYDRLETVARVLEVLERQGKTAVVLDNSSCYAEMGGQVGDWGHLKLLGDASSPTWRINNTQKKGDTYVHWLAEAQAPPVGATVQLAVDVGRRTAIQRHHTVTHLLHWALHQVVSPDAAQKGSFVGPDKLTFDFNGAPLTRGQVAEVERLVNERIVENAPVSWSEVAYTDIKGRPEVMQFFGEKYGDQVRVVQIGGRPGDLDGYSMELCGGTHTRATGEIGLFRVVSEGAIAAGVRRIEAIAGLCAYAKARQETDLIMAVAGKINSPAFELEKKIEALLEHQKELERQLRAWRQKQMAETARGLMAQAQTLGQTRAIVQNLGEADGELLQGLLDILRDQFKGVIVLGGVANGAVGLAASVSPDLVRQFQAGKIIQAIAPIVGGKGGGKPDFARGGGKDPAKLDEALARARSALENS